MKATEKHFLTNYRKLPKIHCGACRSDSDFWHLRDLLRVAISEYCPDSKNKSTATCSAAQSSANFL